MTPRAVLIGLPGAGKSSTGRRLAKIIKTDFADSDHVLEQQFGRSVSELLSADGEGAFRRAEERVIARLIRHADGVLSVGGGAVLSATTRDLLVRCDATVVLLNAGIETLVARVGDARTRPLLAGDSRDRLQTLDDERSQLYRSVAQIMVETDGRTPGQVAATIAARLYERSRA